MFFPHHATNSESLVPSGMAGSVRGKITGVNSGPDSTLRLFPRRQQPFCEHRPDFCKGTLPERFHAED
jgi:hypothetical protein